MKRTADHRLGEKINTNYDGIFTDEKTGIVLEYLSALTRVKKDDAMLPGSRKNFESVINYPLFRKTQFEEKANFPPSDISWNNGNI